MLITHDLAVVAGLADHVAVMREGRVVEADPTERLFRTPRASLYPQAFRRLRARAPRAVRMGQAALLVGRGGDAKLCAA
jgi:peptide/nickel transport system ATP-binding protein